VLELPEETAASMAQMRRVIVDRWKRWRRLNRIVARHGRAMDTVGGGPLSRRPRGAVNGNEEPAMAAVCRRARSPPPDKGRPQPTRARRSGPAWKRRRTPPLVRLRREPSRAPHSAAAWKRRRSRPLAMTPEEAPADEAGHWLSELLTRASRGPARIPPPMTNRGALNSSPPPRRHQGTARAAPG